MKLVDYRKIAPAINSEIEAVLKKHGFKMAKLRATVTEETGEVAIRFVAQDTHMKDSAGSATAPEAERYNSIGPIMGAKLEWLGKTLILGGKP